MKCKDCKYYRSVLEDFTDPDKDFGDCRIRAPRMIVAGCGIGEAPDFNNDWAVVHANDWCGEFEGKK